MTKFSIKFRKSGFFAFGNSIESREQMKKANKQNILAAVFTFVSTYRKDILEIAGQNVGCLLVNL